ncbi:primosomal protein N' [Sphaerisporangium sp. NPDC051011]|uniref:primosomal protein N' n=1 Tax=Sphaerisporangium sp. NPDC051011 TaxID=3155792 RepID=UPI0033DA899F
MAGAGSTAAKGAPVPAAELPVARVLVDTPLAHLDRPFDYLVPEAMAEDAVPGCRVRIRFAGKLVDGFVLERAASTEHEGRLTPLERVVSPEPVLTPQIAALCRAVADRYAGTMADVLRLAIPPRHAKAEAERAAPGPTPPARRAESRSAAAAAVERGVPGGSVAGSQGQAETEATPEGSAEEAESRSVAGPGGVAGSGEAGEPGGVVAGSGGGVGEQDDGSRAAGVTDGLPGLWAEYPAGPAFISALAEGKAPRAIWNALPGIREHGAPTWPEGIALAVLAAVRGGRGALVVVPDGKDVTLVDAALRRVLGEGTHVALTAGLGPAERYRRWLKVLRGEVRVVVGTRAATFAPVHDLGLAVIWDDGDDLHAERLAPYPHTREVLALRAHQTGAAMLVAGHARTAEATRLVATGWAHPIGPARETVRAFAPRVRPAGDDVELARDPAARAARLPSIAWAALRHGLEHGPVLIQVPRRGYLPALACQVCRTPARCTQSPPLAGPPAPVPGAPGRRRRTEAAARSSATGSSAADPAVRPPMAGPGDRPSVAGRAARTAPVGRAESAGPEARRYEADADALGRIGGPARPGAPYGGAAYHGGGGLSEASRGGVFPGARSPGVAGEEGGRSPSSGRWTTPTLSMEPPMPPVEPPALPVGPAALSMEPLMPPVEPSARPGGSAASPVESARGGEGSGDDGRGGGSHEGLWAQAPLCGGPLALRSGHAAPYCRWCGRIAGMWRCQACGSNRMRAVVIGARRTAEELGRAFPSVPVRTSGRDSVLATVGSSRALVVATPGAEPVPDGGYAAAVLLDGWAMLGRPDLRAAEETLRRWMNAAAMLRPGAELIVLADSSLPVVQALLRWDPVTHAERELAERAALGFPPAVRMATLTGPPAAVREMATGLGLPKGAQILGPVPVEGPRGRPPQTPAEVEERLMVRVPRGAEAALAKALKGAAGVRAARKAPDLVRVCMDPMDLV